MGGLGVLCYVLPGLSHDVVVGMDFLAKHNPVVDFAARVLILPDGLRITASCSDSIT